MAQVTITTGSIRQRKDGVYEIRYYKDGKRYSVYSKSEEEAKQKYQKHFKSKKPLGAGTKKSESYNNWLQKWLTLYKKNVSPKTIEDYQRIIKNHIEDSIGQKNIKNIMPDEIQEIINDIAVKSTKMAQITGNVINGSMQKALQIGLINSNPYNLIEKPKHKRQKRVALTKSQQALLLDGVKSLKIAPIIKFYLHSGVRRSEALTLKWDDVSVEKQTITVRGTKTDNAMRTIPLTNQLKEILQSVPNQGEYVFEFNADYITKSFKKLCEKLDLKNITIHSLRHTYATNLFELGVPGKVVQKWLGHADESTTTAIYTHLHTSFERNFIDLIDNSLPPLVPPKRPK